MIFYSEEHGGILISEEDILREYGKRGLKRFNKWMHGQTRPVVFKEDIKIPDRFGWYYWYDFKRWVKGLPITD